MVNPGGTTGCGDITKTFFSCPPRWLAADSCGGLPKSIDGHPRWGFSGLPGDSLLTGANSLGIGS